MKTTFNSLITLLFFVTVLTSCMKYEEVEMVRVTDMGIKNITTKGVNFQVSMQIKNPNNYNIGIVGSDLDLYVKDKKAGKVTLKDKVTLEKKSNTIHHFVFETDYKDLINDPTAIIGSVLGGGKLVVHVKGHIKAKAKGIGKKFPVDFKEKVTL